MDISFRFTPFDVTSNKRYEGTKKMEKRQTVIPIELEKDEIHVPAEYSMSLKNCKKLINL